MSNVRLAVIYYSTYGTNVTADRKPLSDEIKAAIRAQTRRFVDFAGRIAL